MKRNTIQIMSDDFTPAQMNPEEAEDTTDYKVVMNHEPQYSIWPTDRKNASGSTDVGKSGLKAECLEYIKETWTDMGPMSLRRRMEQDALLFLADHLFPRDDKVKEDRERN